MKKCPHCGEELHDDAFFCPSCKNYLKSTKKPKTSSCLITILIVTGLIIVAGIIAVVSESIFPSPPEEINYPYSSWLACEHFIEEVLKAPKTAEFEDVDFDKIHQIDEYTFDMTIQVDAQNELGVFLRAEFYCKTYFENGSWYPVEIKEK